MSRGRAWAFIGVALTAFWIVVIAAAIIVLSGCAGPVSCPPPTIQVSTAAVATPIPVACVALAAITAEPPRVKPQLTRKSGHDLLVVDQADLALRKWGEGLRAQLVACSGG